MDLNDHPVPIQARDTSHQLLLKGPSNWALNFSRDGAAMSSLGTLCPCLTTLRAENFFLMSILNLLCFSLKPFPLILSLLVLTENPSPAFL